VVVEFNGKQVVEVGSFRNSVSMVTPGEVVTMTVVRDGKEVEIEIAVGTLPERETAEASAEERSLAELGFAVQTLTPELAERFELEGITGVVVISVDNNSPAFLAGLRPGMVIAEVNRAEVGDVGEFNAAVEKSDGDTLLLLVRDQRGSRYIALKR
jgi:serine protease Do